MYIFKVDDIEIRGTKEKVKTILHKLGYEYYESSSKGLILLKDMDDEHIRNAIIKLSKEVFDAMRKEPMESFISRLGSNGLNGGYCEEIERLVKELKSRHK